MALEEPTVCVKALRAPFFTAAGRTGKPVSRLASMLDVPLSIIQDDAARVPHSTVVRVWERCAELTADPTFGLAAAEVAAAGPLDLVDASLLRSETLRELAANIKRYQSLFHEANDTAFVETSASLTIRHRYAGELPRSRHLVEFVLATWTARARTALGGRGFAARETTFRHSAPPDLARHRALFGGAVRFDADHDALEIDAETLDVHLPASDGSAPQVTLASTESSERFSARVHAKLVDAIRAGHVDIDVIAQELASSRRTLQRGLGEDGTSFRAVLDGARREVALDVMTRGGATVTDLTFLLGFSDLGAFGRAFRRWTGTTPADYLHAKPG